MRWYPLMVETTEKSLALSIRMRNNLISFSGVTEKDAYGKLNGEKNEILGEDI